MTSPYRSETRRSWYRPRQCCHLPCPIIDSLTGHLCLLIPDQKTQGAAQVGELPGKGLKLFA